MFPRVTVSLERTLCRGNAIFLRQAQIGGFTRAAASQRFFAHQPLSEEKTPSDSKTTDKAVVKSEVKSHTDVIAEMRKMGVLHEDGSPVPAHPLYTDAETEKIKVTHKEAETKADIAAWYAIQAIRKSFDILSGYSYQNFAQTIDEKAVLKRIIFLETVAGVPPMMAGMIRHLQSLRLMRKDNGWIQTLLAEAENERMHLMIALSLRQPGFIFRSSVLLTQFAFLASYGIAYLFAPKFCHRFVGYLEEEAVKTYTHVLELIDADKLPMFSNLAAPPVAKHYYKMEDGAMFRDVLARIRADEAHHRDVNHSLSDIHSWPEFKRPQSGRW